MRNISLWARHHIGPARILLILSYGLLYATGFAIGDMLSLSGLVFHPSFFYLPLAVFITAGFFYPDKKNKEKYRNFYARQKGTDALMAGCTLLLCICYSNRSVSLPQPSAAYASSVRATAAATIEPEPKAKRGFVKRALHKVKHTVHAFRNYYKSRSTAGKVALIILVVIIAFFMLVGIAYLSCALACNEMGAAAVLVSLLGLGLVLLLLTWIIRKINGKPRRRRPERGSASVA